MSIVCSCGKDPTNTAGQKCQSFRHTATLILAIFVEKDNPTSDTAEAGNKNDPCFTAGSHLCPYILVYDILTESGNKEESSSKQLFNVDSSIELDKEMLMQDPYTPSGSDDDWVYEQMPVIPVLPPPPILPPIPPLHPPDTLHSSVLQKFAEAIAGEENEDKAKSTNKSKEETNKYRKFVQCLDLSGVCKDQCCKVSDIVPFGDGQNLLVSFVLCSSCGNKMTLDPNGSSIETEKPVQLSDDSSAAIANHSVQENHAQNDSCEHNFTQTTLAVYRIVINNGKRTLSLQPARTKQFSTCEGLLSSIVALPLESHDLLGDVNICFQEAEADLSSPSQLLVGAIKDSVVLIDANSLTIFTKFTASNGNSRVTHVLNCPGMDCFCACSEDGVMRFLGLRHQQAGEAISDAMGQDRPDGIPQAPSAGSWSQSGKNIKRLFFHLLCFFGM